MKSPSSNPFHPFLAFAVCATCLSRMATPPRWEPAIAAQVDAPASGAATEIPPATSAFDYPIASRPDDREFTEHRVRRGYQSDPVGAG